MILFREPGAEPASQNGPGINAGLMKRHRAGAGIRVVIIADERHRRWVIKRFTQAFKSAHGDKVPELPARASEHCDQTPKDAAAKDQVFTPDAIGDEAG